TAAVLSDVPGDHSITNSHYLLLPPASTRGALLGTACGPADSAAVRRGRRTLDWLRVKGEKYLHRSMLSLMVIVEECLLVVFQAEAVRDDRRDADVLLADQVEIVTHRVLPFTVPSLDPERVRADEIDLFEIMR